jgi:argininosuccinate lyase
LLKEHLFPAFTILRDCMSMTDLMLSNINIRQNILDEDRYKFLFSVEEVNRLVREGMSFRDAYKKVGKDIEAGTYRVTGTRPQHTHEGSIGNLCTEQVRQAMDRVRNGFPFASVEDALSQLTGSAS